MILRKLLILEILFLKGVFQALSAPVFRMGKVIYSTPDKRSEWKFFRLVPFTFYVWTLYIYVSVPSLPWVSLAGKL